MTSSARDLRYGRRGGRWAEPWTDEDEARYQAALTGQAHDCIQNPNRTRQQRQSRGAA